ncbi:hypothetical protein SCAB_22941 [Streptomyces scabiei 87.22]|uniref:Uncharacterized protein n=1 Tax=Streptomyces scabiei (strain 87.22) TaxID=680198 RepID=C9YYV3_STRSW|nr:hypothetical protein SCAB_22941 [Streptomyces scabiei 87.22]
MILACAALAGPVGACAVLGVLRPRSFVMSNMGRSVDQVDDGRNRRSASIPLA